MKEIDDLHAPFEKWLKDNRVPYIHFNPVRRTGVNVSHPDFTILWMGGNVSIEFKTPTGKLSQKQEARIKYLEASGNQVFVCRSVEEAIQAIPFSGVAKLSELGARWIIRRQAGSYADNFNTMRAQVESHVAQSEGAEAVRLETDERFIVMKFGGKDSVFARNRSGAYVRIRVATPADLINLKRIEP